MARIAPAKPKILDPYLLETFLKLESELSDKLVVFQNFPLANSLLITGVNLDPLVFVSIENADRVDFDEMALHKTNGESVDFDLLAGEIRKELNDASININPQLIIHTPNFKSSNLIDIPSNTLKSDISFLTGLFNVVSFIEMKLEIKKNPIDEQVINSIINQISPGSSPFEEGKITEAQQKWRDSSKEEPKVNSQITTLANKMMHVGEESYEKDVENVIMSPALPTKEIKPDSPKAPIRVEYLEKMIHNILYNLAKDRPIYSSGVEIDPVFVSAKDCLLPAVIVAASEMWTPIVIKTGGKGGFDIRLKTDPEALLGFSVVDVLPSAPMVLFMPITHLFRTMLNDGEFILDDIVAVFGRWVMKHNLENTQLQEIDLKIALKAIEGS